MSKLGHGFGSAPVHVPVSPDCLNTACHSVSGTGDGIHAARARRLPSRNTGGEAWLSWAVSSQDNLLFCSILLDCCLPDFTQNFLQGSMLESDAVVRLILDLILIL